MRTLGRPQVVEREPRCGRLGLRFPFSLRFGDRHLLLSFFLCGHLHEVTHLLEHAAQRRVIGVHDFILVMFETQCDQRALHPVGVAAAGAHLLDPQVSLSRGRQYPIAARFPLTVFACRGQPTHASPPIPASPLPSPTATSALKLKRRPPFTTFATRLIATTFSTIPSLSRWRSPPSRRSPPRPLPRPPRPPPPPRGPRAGRCSSGAGGTSAAGTLVAVPVSCFWSSIKTPVLLCARHRPRLSRVRGTDSRRDRTPLSRSLFLLLSPRSAGRARRSARPCPCPLPGRLRTYRRRRRA